MKLSKAYLDRMDGLTSIKEMKNFKNSMTKIFNDLVDEGFEEEDAKAFLIHQINNL